MKPTNLRETSQIIWELKDNCAAGYDNVTKKDIIRVHDAIAPVIVNIINDIIKTGEYPDELKIAKITPVYKNEATKMLTTIGQYHSDEIQNNDFCLRILPSKCHEST